MKSISFIFVCHKGELEGLSLVLAASLKRHIKVPFKMIAAVPLPEAKWGAPSPKVIAGLESLGVRIENFTHDVDLSKPGMPQSNKIHSLSIPVETDKVAFIDTDMLCMRALESLEYFDAPFCAAPTFYASWKKWDAVYKALSMDLPEERIPTLYSDEMQLPYFNSGFFVMDAGLAQSFSQQWADNLEKIEVSGALASNHYFRDQVSLAATVMQQKLPYKRLDQNFNYWVESQPVTKENTPIFLHHTWKHPPTHRQPLLEEAMRDLVLEYPFIEACLGGTRWRYYTMPAFVQGLYRSCFKIKRSFVRA